MAVQLLENTKDLKSQLAEWRKNGLSVGFVPTMGALHKGHLSLVKQSLNNNAKTVVSIFVNPTQFNNSSDLEKYPRDLQRDVDLLNQLGEVAVFHPSVQEMYPKNEGPTRSFEFGHLERVMEGQHRPGHFDGVAQIVSKLFDLVTPDRAYFGEKDFQQLAVVQEMTRQAGYNIKVVPCAIVREENGLAMSSRNERLTTDQRNAAALLYSSLQHARNWAQSLSIEEVKGLIKAEFEQNEQLDLEYFELAEPKTLLPSTDWDAQKGVRGFIAAFAGDVRLIDTMELLKPQND